MPHMSAKHRPKRSMQDMGATVVARGILTPLCVHLGLHRVAHRYVALIDDSFLYNQSGHRAVGILDGNNAIGATDSALIAQLTATLCVEG